MMVTTAEELGNLLADTYAQPGRQVAVPAALEPHAAAAAYQAQAAFLRRNGLAIGGWKIGSKSADGPVQGAPLPTSGLHPGGAVLPFGDFPVCGLEVEIMFRFDRDFLPDDAAVGSEQVLASIGSIAASIEIVSSRLIDWPDVPKLNQLADLQNHGALILGEFVPYSDAVDFVTPHAQLQIDGVDVFTGTGANPCGDPRRLLHWLVGHCREQKIALPAGTVITAGSYTGMFFAQGPGQVTGTIAGLPEVAFTLV